ncbi:MAG TPA: Rrf2 family transcriptional regulator [Candidatus Bathyarchaeia archaeon]|nr:Rrf2 family transcriptional regulator [Candidatus Bathyarchaeia archaeon]
MFGLTKKTEYGLQLMVHLAKNFGHAPIPLKQVAKEKKLPYRFLSQVASTLKKAGLIETKEGIKGGCFLAKSPEKVTVAEILEVLEGPLELVECLKAEASCPWASGCGQKQMFEKMKGSLKKIIKAHTLEDLIKK